MVELLYATGIRVSELAGLDVDDVDHELIDPVFDRPIGDPAWPPTHGHSDYWLDEKFDVVVLVDAPEAVRRERIVRDRGLSPEAARKALHVALGLTTLAFPWLFDDASPVLALAACSDESPVAGRATVDLDRVRTSRQRGWLD